MSRYRFVNEVPSRSVLDDARGPEGALTVEALAAYVHTAVASELAHRPRLRGGLLPVTAVGEGPTRRLRVAFTTPSGRTSAAASLSEAVPGTVVTSTLYLPAGERRVHTSEPTSTVVHHLLGVAETFLRVRPNRATAYAPTPVLDGLLRDLSRDPRWALAVLPEELADLRRGAEVTAASARVSRDLLDGVPEEWARRREEDRGAGER